jgi:hypothetical protein
MNYSMKKKLDTDAMLNELRTSSAFFKQPEPTAGSELSIASPARNEQVPQVPTAAKDEEKAPAGQKDNASSRERMLTNKQENEQERKQGSLQARVEETIEDRILAALVAAHIKPNIFRYSVQELDFIRDVVYEAEVKYQTRLDKNDVVRIALEWLMNDYQEKVEGSLLARLLTRKKARK